MPPGVPILAMVFGVFLILHAVVTVVTDKPGRVPLPPLVALVLAFGLLLLGQYLLGR